MSSRVIGAAASAGAREIALTENDSEHRGGDRAMTRTRERKASTISIPRAISIPEA